MTNRAVALAEFARRNALPPRAPDLHLTAHDWRAFDTPAEIARWDALAQWASEPNPFFESWYLLPSLRALDPEVKVELLALEADGVLAGLLPLRRERRYYGKPLPHRQAWVHPNCFLGTPLVAKGFEPAFWRALLADCDAEPGAALFLHLPALGLDGPLAAALEDVLADDGRPWGVVQRERRAMLAADGSAESYSQTALSRRKRKDLARRLRRLEELGDVRFRWATGASGIDKWIADFLALEGAGWKGKAGSALRRDPATAAIFRESLTKAAAHGRLLRLSLTLDGRPLAMLSTFLAEPGAFGFKTAFDERYGRFAPGVLLEAEFLSAIDRRPFEWCDSCAAADHPVMNAMWRERRAVGKVSIGIGGRVRRGVFNRLLQLERWPQPQEANP